GSGCRCWRRRRSGRRASPRRSRPGTLRRCRPRNGRARIPRSARSRCPSSPTPAGSSPSPVLAAGPLARALLTLRPLGPDGVDGPLARRPVARTRTAHDRSLFLVELRLELVALSFDRLFVFEPIVQHRLELPLRLRLRLLRLALCPAAPAVAIPGG